MNIFQFSSKMKCPPHTHNCINRPALFDKSISQINLQMKVICVKTKKNYYLCLFNEDTTDY